MAAAMVFILALLLAPRGSISKDESVVLHDNRGGEV